MGKQRSCRPDQERRFAEKESLLTSQLEFDFEQVHPTKLVHARAILTKQGHKTKNRHSFSDRKEKPRIFKPPGSLMMRFAHFFFSAESVREVFVPLYNDFWYEYEKAFVAGHKWKGHWIRVRYYWAFAKAAGLLKLFSWIWDKVESVINKLA